MPTRITYKYNHCEAENLHKDLSFNEESFSEILLDCFDTNNNVTSVEVIFEHNPAQATEKFSCAVNVQASGHTLYIKETGEDAFSKVVTQACHKAVKLVREEKQDLKRSQDIDNDLETETEL